MLFPFFLQVCLLEVLLPCMLSILAVLERPSKRSSQSPNPMNRYDHIFQRLLSSTEVENKIVLRRLYTSHLPQFILILGINSARHMKRLIRVITSYLEVSNKLILCKHNNLPQFILILGINSARHMKRPIRVITCYLEVSNKLILCKYNNLPQFILILGINSARHMKRLMRVITSYLEVSNEHILCKHNNLPQFILILGISNACHMKCIKCDYLLFRDISITNPI